MGGVLHVDGVVPDDWGDCRVVAHHGLGTFLTVQLQERLQADNITHILITISRDGHD